MANDPAILVVEDKALVRLDICDYLRDQDFRVVEASNAQQAIDILEGGEPVSVVFTDVRMPGPLDGLDLARFVRAKFPRIKIMITSGHMTRLDELPGIGRFFDKPYSHRQIADCIKDALADG